ncbi:MAG: hypothetical protein QXP55_04475 [Nitrososphaerales archaeon]
MSSYFDVSKYFDIELDKVSISKEPELRPTISFQIILHNKSDRLVESNSIKYAIHFNLPKEDGNSEFKIIARGSILTKFLIDAESSIPITLEIEIPHLRVLYLSKIIKSSIEGKLEVYAFFDQIPVPYQPPFSRDYILAYEYLPDFPISGIVCKFIEFRVPIEEWKVFAKRVELFFFSLKNENNTYIHKKS